MQVKNQIDFLNIQIIKNYEIVSIFWIETEYTFEIILVDTREFWTRPIFNFFLNTYIQTLKNYQYFFTVYESAYE